MIHMIMDDRTVPNIRNGPDFDMCPVDMCPVRSVIRNLIRSRTWSGKLYGIRSENPARDRKNRWSENLVPDQQKIRTEIQTKDRIESIRTGSPVVHAYDMFVL